MAIIFPSVGGRKLTKVVATNEGVQDYLRGLLFAMQAHAAANLLEHRSAGDAAIETDHGRVDWYLVLSDERGQKAAMSIEFGRAARVDEETGDAKGAMEGLFILHRATNLARGGRGKVRF